MYFDKVVAICDYHKNMKYELRPLLFPLFPWKEPLAKTKKRYLNPEIYYHVEVGKEENKIWFKIDSEKVFEFSDPESYEGGKISLSIRGTALEMLQTGR